MKNTYINDTSLVNYPFADDKTPPFPKHAVRGMSVFILVKSPFTVSSVNVSGVEIGSGQISLAVTVNDTMLVGMVTAKSGAYGTFNVETADYKATMILAAGNLEGLEPMSKGCWLDLYPDCVRIHGYSSSRGNLIGYQTVTVNGYTYDCGECIGLQTAGDIQVTGVVTEHTCDHVASWDDVTVVTLEGFAAYGSGTTVQSSIVGYPMVTSINGVEVPGSKNMDTTLYLHVAAMPDEDPTAAAGRGRLSFGVVNALKPTDIRMPDEPDPGSHNWKPSVSYNDETGSGLVLTVIGGPDIPTCFSQGDESGTPDADNALPAAESET